MAGQGGRRSDGVRKSKFTWRANAGRANTPDFSFARPIRIGLKIGMTELRLRSIPQLCISPIQPRRPPTDWLPIVFQRAGSRRDARSMRLERSPIVFVNFIGSKSSSTGLKICGKYGGRVSHDYVFSSSFPFSERDLSFLFYEREGICY